MSSEKKHGKFVQLAPLQLPTVGMVLYALDDQGGIWWHAGTGWVLVPDGEVMPASTAR